MVAYGREREWFFRACRAVGGRPEPNGMGCDLGKFYISVEPADRDVFEVTVTAFIDRGDEGAVEMLLDRLADLNRELKE